jgi:hypothetical protein
MIKWKIQKEKYFWKKEQLLYIKRQYVSWRKSGICGTIEKAIVRQHHKKKGRWYEQGRGKEEGAGAGRPDDSGRDGFPAAF